MNWKQLKDFCNSLTEEQLEKRIIMWREDEAVNKIKAMTLEEDHFVGIEFYENGCFSESEMKSQIKQNKDLSLKDFKKVYEKGFPLLHEDF